MKKIVTLLLISLALFGCKKGDAAPKEESLVGTIWTTNQAGFFESLLAIEFVDETNVQTYTCSSNLNVNIRTIRKGTYTKSGNKVIFNNLKYFLVSGDGNITDGELSTNHFTVNANHYSEFGEKDYYDTFSFVKSK